MRSSVQFERLTLEWTNRVLRIRMCGAGDVNAIDGVLHRELATVFPMVALDAQTDVVVLEGSPRAFSGGADIAWLQSLTATDRDVIFAEGRRIVLDMLEVPQPVIAALRGPVVGLGATVALLCDLRIASETVRIGDPHVRVGLVAGDGGAVLWPWLVGAGRAKEYLLTGDIMTAAEAERIGLVNRVVSDAELDETVESLADRLARSHRKAIQGTKASVNKLLREAANLVLDTSLALEKECMASPDHQEALAAFVEHRRPGFSRR